MIGGQLSDRCAARYPTLPHARLIPLFYPSVLGILAGILFGYSLQYGLHLAIVLVSQFFIGLAEAMVITSVMSFLPSARPKNAGSVGALLMFSCFGSSAIFVSITVQVADAIGLGNYFILLGGVDFVSTLICVWLLLRVFSVKEILFPAGSCLGKEEVGKIAVSTNQESLSSELEGQLSTSLSMEH